VVLAKLDLHVYKMKISVVIPLYNKELSIQRAINSVLKQTEQDFEIIVVNDGSTDKSAELVANYHADTRVRLIHQENAGVSGARNRGVAEARSDLIAFLDADDEWLPGFLESILELHSQFVDGDVYCTLYSVQDFDRNLVYPNTGIFYKPDYRGYITNYLEVLRKVLPFNIVSFCVTKTAFQGVGGFPPEIKYGEDVDIFIRLSLKYKIVFLNRSLAIYHRDAENRACEEYEKSLQEYYPVVNLAKMIRNGEVPAQMRQSAIEYVAKSQLSLAKGYLHFGDPVKARELIRSCAGTKAYRGLWYLLYMSTFIPTKVYKPLVKISHKFRRNSN